MSFPITEDHISRFQQDGAVLIPGLFANFIDRIAEGIDYNLANPGPYAADNLKHGETGRFFDDYCNWQRISSFEEVIINSSAGQVAAALMKSNTAQLFHDHVLVKEPGTLKPTPWHQDSPYYFLHGQQTVSFWVPVDPVVEATLRCVKGSHKWEKEVLPTRWLSDENFYPDQHDYLPVPDPDKENMEILAWPLQPGDAVAFNFRTMHGARGNQSTIRRRALSIRFVGDDVVFCQKPGKTSPPFPDHNMCEGQKLREDWFPVIFDKMKMSPSS